MAVFYKILSTSLTLIFSILLLRKYVLCDDVINWNTSFSFHCRNMEIRKSPMGLYFHGVSAAWVKYCSGTEFWLYGLALLGAVLSWEKETMFKISSIPVVACPIAFFFIYEGHSYGLILKWKWSICLYWHVSSQVQSHKTKAEYAHLFQHT